VNTQPVRVPAVSARSGIPAFEVMRVIDAVVARRATGLPVFDLSAGQPSTPAPTTVRAAAARAIGADRLGYTNALGIPALRAAIARHYLRTDDLDVPAGSVAVTTGSSGGFLLAFLAAFDPGDTVVMARPGYPAYRNMLAALGCTVLELACGPETRFQPTAAQLDALPVAPQGIVLASPANPTGTMVAPAELAAITAWCDLHGVRLVSDEIYHGISYTEPAISAWRFSRSSIVVNSFSKENYASHEVVTTRAASPSAIVIGSFSKYFSMTGWRIGWMLVPDDLMDSVDRLAGNFTICPPTLSQLAAVAAFDAYDELDANVQRYRANRDLLLTRLPEIGVERFAPPDGAFYIYADVSRWTDDSLTWCARLLDETGIAVAPGVDFDRVHGGKFIRMCFAGDAETISQATDVMGAWLARQPTR
jgi:aspartate/methionine/tyrosine aminotransferase